MKSNKEKESNPLQWIRTKIANARANETDNTLTDHKLSWGKNPLKFYENRSGRYSVNYKNTHICTCTKEEIPEIQKHFDKQYRKKPVEDISEELKVRYNEKIKRNKIKEKRHRNSKTYKESKLQFEEKPTGRIQVRVNDNGKVHTICQCYPDQKFDVIKKFNELKKTHELDSLKSKMKKEYNLRGKSRDDDAKHTISISDDGAIYKDGKYMKVNKSIYDFVNGIL